MPKEIWLKQRWVWVAVREECEVDRNMGVIEKSYYRGPGTSGRLHFLNGLSHLQPHAHPRTFIPSLDGRGPRKAGSGYLGYIDFGSIGEAVRFLSRHLNVRWCPIGGVIETSAGSHIPFPGVTSKKKFWDALKNYLNDLRKKRGVGITRIVFRGGGNIRIPDEFKDWCKENGIDIVVLNDAEFDLTFPPEVWIDEDDAPYLLSDD